jgi:hypothetical protein
MSLSPAQRQALLLMVAVGCSDLGRWGHICTENDLSIERMDDEDLTLVCDQLVAMGLLQDIGGDFLALFCPTLMGGPRGDPDLAGVCGDTTTG